MSVPVAEIRLAANDGNMRAQAQAGDIRTGIVAHLRHQRQVCKADGRPWGTREKPSRFLKLPKPLSHRHCIEGYPQALKDPAWSLTQTEAARHIPAVFLTCWALGSACPVSQLSVQDGRIQPTPPITLTGGNDDTVGGVPWAAERMRAASKSFAQVAKHALCYSYRQKETGQLVSKSCRG